MIGPFLSARLVSAHNANSHEKNEHLDAVSEEKLEFGEVFLQNEPVTLQPATPSGTKYFPEQNPNPVYDSGAREILYFSSDLLAVRPYPLTILESPQMLEPLPVDAEGRIVLKVWISDAGEVTATETEFTDMPATIHEAIVTAFQGMRFMPGQIDGKAVGSIMRIEMTYEDFRLPVQ